MSVGFHGPAHHQTTCQVEHDRQIEPPLPRRQVGNVRTPHAIRPRHGFNGKLPLQMIGRDGLKMARIGGARSPTSRTVGTQVGGPHQPCHPLAATAPSLCTEFSMNARAAIALTALLEDGLNRSLKLLVLLCTVTRLARLGRIEATT
jgi:hypothetical protein